jgi:hypothetical protein
MHGSSCLIKQASYARSIEKKNDETQDQQAERQASKLKPEFV